MSEIEAILAHPGVAVALRTLEAEHDRTVDDIVALTEIPSPPFGEEKRAAAYLEMLRAHGLDEVETDTVGNVMGLRRGTGEGGIVAVAAHLDTVFPHGTDVRVRREGTRLSAPGIGDDTRSLAVLLAIVRALDAGDVRTNHDILFVGDVGEEGNGDLRGVRHLFGEGRHRERIRAFFTVDSPNMERLVIGAVGSKRYKVTFKGPGGHSFRAFGSVNPIYAMAAAISELSALEVSDQPRTTYCVSVVGGGTSVNAIPEACWIEIDLRSEAPSELARLDREVQAIIARSVEAENAVRSTANGSVSAEVATLGDRPAGRMPEGAGIVVAAAGSLRAFGFDVSFEAASTDANVPMSLGIPALMIGSGGSGGRNHSLDEWIDVERSASVRGMSAVLTAIVAVAGLT